MVNLLLTFPDLDGTSFAPWLPADEVGGRDRVEVAAEVAARWRDGLEGAGLGGDDVAAVRDGVRWQVITPGVASAAPLDILPSLAPPERARSQRPGRRPGRVDGVVSALLSLVGRGGDPLTDRDHVLLASVVLDHWRRGEALDLAGLVRSVHGDLGLSTITHEPVFKEFITLFPATIELSICAMLLALLIGVPAGIIAAVKRNTVWDYSVMGASLTGFSMPIFWWGLLLILTFSVTLGWTPVSGRIAIRVRHSAGHRLHADRLAALVRQRRVQECAVAPDPAVDRARHDPARGDRAHDALVDARSAA